MGSIFIRAGILEIMLAPEQARGNYAALRNNSGTWKYAQKVFKMASVFYTWAASKTSFGPGIIIAFEGH